MIDESVLSECDVYMKTLIAPDSRNLRACIGHIYNTIPNNPHDIYEGCTNLILVSDTVFGTVTQAGWVMCQ